MIIALRIPSFFMIQLGRFGKMQMVKRLLTIVTLKSIFFMIQALFKNNRNRCIKML